MQLATGYEAAKIINEILVASDRKPVPTQFVYQYMSKGFITTYETGKVNTKTGRGQKLVDLDGSGDKDFPAWMVKYLGRKGITVDMTEVESEKIDTAEMQSAARG
jgi:hypothetical protein